MSPADYVQKARVETAVRALSDQVSRGLTEPWVRAMRRASTSGFDDLDDRLDRAVGSTELGVSGTPLWCRLVRALQWVLLLGALTGAVWLGSLAVAGYLQVTKPGTPDYAGVPVPTLLLVGGVVSGVVLALLSRALIAVGSRSRARRAEKAPARGGLRGLRGAGGRAGGGRAGGVPHHLGRPPHRSQLTGSRPQPRLRGLVVHSFASARSVVRRLPVDLPHVN